MYKLFLLSLFLLLFLNPSTSFATQVRIPDSYFFTSSGGPFAVYDDLTGEFIGGGIEYYEGYELNAEFFKYLSSEYKIVEISSQNVCQNSFLSYTDCIGSPYFIQIVDTVNLYLPLSDGGGGGGGGDPILDEGLAPAAGGHSVTSYPPEVTIYSFFKGLLFSDNLILNYKVIDQNDNGIEKSSKGLSDNPVSIYISDQITNWYDNFFGSNNKTEIAKDQPKEGKFVLSVKDLVPGVLYKIIVEAVDKASLWGQGITEYFSVDFTEPSFTVKTDPNAIRSGEVTIIIDSNEDLLDIPEVKVTQYGSEIKKVVMKGDKSHFEGKYTVIPGFDGTAVISVSGKDLAGNLGTAIIGGGTFSVGMNPPPKPTVNKYQEKIVTNLESIDVAGSSRADTEVILKVNGVETSSIKPDTKGNFTFTKILLNKNKNKGINYINIYARDPLGSISEGVPIEVKYNISPVVKIIKPVDGELLSSISSINVDGTDENGDTLFYTYQALTQINYDNKLFNWTILSQDDPSSTFSWNTTEVEDGNYVIQVIANDGNIKTTSNVVKVSIKNILPYFRFEDGRNTVTNQSSISVKGKALTSTNVSPRPDIISVAYSMDQGGTWSPVKISNDGGSYQKKFSVEFTDLKEGVYPILWRTKDSRGFIGKVIHSIIVDKTIPKAPTITTPNIISSNLTINDSNDEDINKAGIQINIKGNTEPNARVVLTYDDKTIITKALSTGVFTFTDVTFNKKGKYIFNISAVDLAGNKSPNTNFSIVYNNLPTITVLNPKAFRGLSGKANISWVVKDVDGDALSNVSVSYRNKSIDTIFKNLVTNTNPVGNYSWNTDLLPESENYELKISANDPYGSISQIISFAIDRTPPILTSFVFNKNQTNDKNNEVSFICGGEMTDNLSGIEFIEYKIEDSTGAVSPWYKGLITEGLLRNKATFSIKHPLLTIDDTYKVSARAVDASGNVSAASSLSLSIDKSSPKVGGFFIEKNGVDISPDETGKIILYKNSIFSFNISLEEDTESADIIVGNKSFKLEKDLKSHLWKTEISINEESTNKLYVNAKDNSGNVTVSKEIGILESVLRGVISITNNDETISLIRGATIQILKLNKNRNQFEDYVSISNNQSNVIVSNQSGEYDLVLPEGSYQFIIKESNIKTLKYEYNSDRSSIVNINFNVSPVSSFMKLINSFIGIFK